MSENISPKRDDRNRIIDVAAFKAANKYWSLPSRTPEEVKEMAENFFASPAKSIPGHLVRHDPVKTRMGVDWQGCTIHEPGDEI